MDAGVHYEVLASVAISPRVGETKAVAERALENLSGRDRLVRGRRQRADRHRRAFILHHAVLDQFEDGRAAWLDGEVLVGERERIAADFHEVAYREAARHGGRRCLGACLLRVLALVRRKDRGDRHAGKEPRAQLAIRIGAVRLGARGGCRETGCHAGGNQNNGEAIQHFPVSVR
ncbi:hypothetical protein F01_420439 [Burkholderia cenocepacia]|nr:hypothetical protein F01_420439 [Burkholderia cenocepacia]